MGIKIFAMSGIEVFDKDDALFVCFDAGESATGDFCVGQITIEQFKQLQLSEKDAYDDVLGRARVNY